MIIWLKYSFWYGGNGGRARENNNATHRLVSRYRFTSLLHKQETYIVLDYSDVTRRHEAEIT